MLVNFAPCELLGKDVVLGVIHWTLLPAEGLAVVPLQVRMPSRSHGLLVLLCCEGFLAFGWVKEDPS